jgi:hypothetical protein
MGQCARRAKVVLVGHGLRQMDKARLLGWAGGRVNRRGRGGKTAAVGRPRLRRGATIYEQ